MKDNFKVPVIFVAILLCAILLSTVLSGMPQQAYEQLTYSEFLSAAQEDRISHLNLTEYVAVGGIRIRKFPRKRSPTAMILRSTSSTA